MEIVKDMLLVLGGSMLGVTVMCLMNARSSGLSNGKERKVTK